jgi:hypothetical protein
VFQYNFQQHIPQKHTPLSQNLSRESVRSLLFKLLPEPSGGITPLPLLPAIDCMTDPKPLAPEHLMGPPITP